MTFTQEWIDVNDRLPEQAGTYLVNIHEVYETNETELENNLVLKAWYNPTYSLFAPKDIGWSLIEEFYPYSESMREHITHWTEWPKPIEDYK